MDFNKDIIDVFGKYCKARNLSMRTVNATEYYEGPAKEIIVETDVTIYNDEGFEYCITFDWLYGHEDSASTLNRAIKRLEEKLWKYERETKYDVPSLYPKLMLNSIYGWADPQRIDYEKYRKMDIAVTKHMQNCFFSPKPIPSIDKVIFNDPATIVFWKDGTKTIVKAQDGDTFDAEKGLAMAISKKALGNKGKYYNELKKWLPDEGDKGNFVPLESGEIEKKLKELEKKIRNFKGETSFA